MLLLKNSEFRTRVQEFVNEVRHPFMLFIICCIFVSLCGRGMVAELGSRNTDLSGHRVNSKPFCRYTMTIGKHSHTCFSVYQAVEIDTGQGLIL